MFFQVDRQETYRDELDLGLCRQQFCGVQTGRRRSQIHWSRPLSFLEAKEFLSEHITCF